MRTIDRVTVRYFTVTDVVGRVVVLAGCISDAAMGGQPDPGAEKLTCAIRQTLEEQPVLNSKSWLTSLQNDYSLPDSLTERIWLTLISQRISRGELREFELADGNWLLDNAWYERNMAGFNEKLRESLSFTPDELKTLFRNRLNLSPEANDDFLDRCLDGGDWYPFQKAAVLYHSTTWMSFVSVPPAG